MSARARAKSCLSFQKSGGYQLISLVVDIFRIDVLLIWFNDLTSSHTNLWTDKIFDGHLAETGQFMEETNFYDFFFHFLICAYKFQTLKFSNSIYGQAFAHTLCVYFNFLLFFVFFHIFASPAWRVATQNRTNCRDMTFILDHLRTDRAQSKLWLFLFFGCVILMAVGPSGGHRRTHLLQQPCAEKWIANNRSEFWCQLFYYLHKKTVLV